MVFEEKKIHGKKGYIVTPEGVPRAILENTVRPYPVLVRKHFKGWESVILESAG